MRLLKLNQFAGNLDPGSKSSREPQRAPHAAMGRVAPRLRWYIRPFASRSRGSVGTKRRWPTRRSRVEAVLISQESSPNCAKIRPIEIDGLQRIIPRQSCVQRWQIDWGFDPGARYIAQPSVGERWFPVAKQRNGAASKEPAESRRLCELSPVMAGGYHAMSVAGSPASERPLSG